MIKLMATKNKSVLITLEDKLEELLVHKAPPLPTAWKEVIVQYSPWITLILMILVVPPLLALLGLGAVLAPVSYMGGVNNGINYTFSLLVSVVSLVLEAMAIPGLFKRSRKAWYLLYYSTLLGAVSSLIEFNIGGLIIGTLVSMYILFQVKSYYK